MGGMGSGRHWYLNAKNTTDDYRAIDVRRWNREGLLKPGESFIWTWLRNEDVLASINVTTESDKVVLDYKHRNRGGEWEDISYSVHLDWTECNYGGRRPWLLCPAHGCGKRVAKLYGGKIFACRHCYGLVYASQREALHDRAIRHVNKIRERLEWEPGFLNGKGFAKPKGMHWRTFERLCAEYDHYAGKSMSGIMEFLNRYNKDG
jgi:hypothetical protein